jgi:hypothetical protein
MPFQKSTKRGDGNDRVVTCNAREARDAPRGHRVAMIAGGFALIFGIGFRS